MIDNYTITYQTVTTTDAMSQIGVVEQCGSHSQVEQTIKSKRGGYRPGSGRKRILPMQVYAPPAAPDVERWYCVRTKSGAEIDADATMVMSGFETFLPLMFIPAVAAGRTATGRTIPSRPECLRPLFPRYIFVRFRKSTSQWRYISSMRGVEHIFSTSPESPTAVLDSVIDLIKSQCDPDGCLFDEGHGAKSIPLVPMAAGVNVKVLSGPMSDLSGTVQWSDGQRVRLLMMFMGGQRVFTVDRAVLEAV